MRDRGSGRFIGEEQPRLIDQRANYRGALSFAARTGPDAATCASRPTRSSRRSARECAAVVPLAAWRRWHEHVFLDRALWQEVMELKNEPDLAIAHWRFHPRAT